MARVTINNPLSAFRSKTGEMLFRLRSSDTSTTNMAPDSDQKPNPQNIDTDGLHPIYKELARATNKSAYSIALSDKMMPPVIHRILLRGCNILVQASDNVMVAKVEVQVFGEHGELLERGNAVRLKADWWEYIPSYAGIRITAAAWDLAGNVTKADL